VPQKTTNEVIEREEVLFTDRKGMVNGGTVVKRHDANLIEVEYETENGKEYALAKRNKNGEYDFVNSKPTPAEQIPMENRTNENVGNRKVKAYQYLHPEVKHFIQGEAYTLLGELKRTKQGGGRASRDDYGTVISGREARVTTQDLAGLLDGIKFDGKQGSKYQQIEKALQSIIEDNGAENNALAKKIELVIDDRLSNGYFDDVYGDEIPPSKEYVELKNKIEGEKKVAKAEKEVAATKTAEAIKDLAEVEKGNNVRSASGKAYYTKGLKGLAFNRQLINKGVVNLKGQVVRTPAEVAAIAQVYRDPRFETFRMIYLKGDVVVGHEGFTSKVPTAALITDKETLTEHKEAVRETMKKLGADGYYMLHNHPSGNPTPSPADLNTTKVISQVIPGFKGHVIINSNKFASIDIQGKSEVKSLYLNEKAEQELLNSLLEKYNVKTEEELYKVISEEDANKHIMFSWKDDLLSPEIEHELLNTSLRDPEVAAQVAKQFQLNKNTSVVLYLDAKLKIRAIQEVENKHFKDYKTAIAYLKPRAVEFGAASNIIVTGRNADYALTLRDLIKNGISTDVIYN
jgi:proteasome lid subunit RPN8/RPN11